ncbi:ATP-binding domain-containing protein [[Clostridium] sordellii]|uniref:ATP-binding protein n=1 Tax=Paraclostridium sordellii TaxID=1505 RepID=UPI0005E2D419|nr:ATP-binding protein [Paeniclostridium sordellii]CEN76366.1 ATP-binding domain-containing protein [[Clostridium] sordellii] [Paeniclostridium sordellii]
MLDNNIFWIVVTFITLILEWIVLKKVIDYTSDKRFSNFKNNIIISIIIIFASGLTVIDIFPNCRIIIFIIVTIVFYKYSYYESTVKCVLVSLIYWMILLGIDAVSMSSIIWVNSLEGMDILIKKNIYRLEAITLSKGILIGLLFLYYRLKVKIDISKKDVIYILIPIITNIFSFLVIFQYIFEFNDINIIDSNQILIMSFLLLLSNISLILSLRKIIINNKLITESNIIKDKMKTQYSHYTNMKESQSKVRELHHDIKNHIACLKSRTLSNNNVNKYIDSIEKELDNYDKDFNTGNMILDIILNEKNKICKENNINIIVDINFSRCNFIDLIDVCSIFSNILDNAIEACTKVETCKREVILRGNIVNNIFIIRIENSKINKLNIKNNNIETDKKNKFLHGLGIRSVKNSVQKYNGEVAINYTENKFIMKIIIPLRE